MLLQVTPYHQYRTIGIVGHNVRNGAEQDIPELPLGRGAPKSKFSPQMLLRLYSHYLDTLLILANHLSERAFIPRISYK